MTAGATLHLSGSKVNGMILALGAAMACALIPAAHAQDGSGINDIALASSVMWQPLADGSKFVYPPGIPAVLPREQASRTFRIEQYYNMQLSGDMLVPHVRGTWARSGGSELAFDAVATEWKNNYVTVTQPVCDQTGSAYGYRCTTDLTFAPSTPTGTIGISLGLVAGGIEFTHPNSIFWVILPETTLGLVNAPAAHAPRLARLARRVESVRRSPGYAAVVASPELAAASKYVVRITLDGNVSLGTGFITRTIDPLGKMFKPQVMEAAAMISDPKIFVVTAAHLFPVAYGETDDPLANGVIDAEAQPFRLGYTYDLDVNGQYLPQAALLLARNVESDIALLQIRKSSLTALASALGAQAAGDIPGLTFADGVGPLPAPGPLETVLGYPAILGGKLVRHVGRLAIDEYPTDDTSNFGPIHKLKLMAAAGDGELAEPGMSGGPVLDRAGRVVGLAVERPNDTNSLIALDLTSVAKLTSGYALDDKKCLLRFNPFDRILSLVRRDANCDYGRFGSPRGFGLLDGEWTIQEILGFDDGTSGGGALQNTNGHSIINGQAVINGHSIINGLSVIKQLVLIVNRENLADVNATKMLGGFKLNPDAFRSFAPKGVRILAHDGPAATAAPLGALILGTRESSADNRFDPVYSIRDFAIWLHRKAAAPDSYAKLLCLSGNTCE